jgi:serine/threonine protein kinase
MSLQVIGPYEILGALGAGGMGEVFRARDTRLNREVAIKILPKEFASDPQRLRRFEQESKTLAALNHPNILTIYDAGLQDGTPYLVSELLEGQTLREQLSGGALAVRKATDFALQVAQGLAAAHNSGITHRDLKPENIFITQDGRVKILDFGLAKASPRLQSQIANQKSQTDQVDPAASTLLQTTEPGMILGTPAYMSPEQVRGEPADHRSDIFAFGCVLYEMLSGKRVFRRETPAECMSAVLKDDPGPLTDLGSTIAPALERLVQRCLEKRPELRFQSASDLAFSLDNLGSALNPALPKEMLRRGGDSKVKTFGPWVFALLAIAFGISAFLKGTGVSKSSLDLAPPVLRKFELTLDTPGKTSSGGGWLNPAISPDGRKIAYANPDGLWLRWLNRSPASVLLVAGENIAAPFWSPESEDVAYFQGKKLMRVSITGSRPTVIEELPENFQPSPWDDNTGAWLAGGRVIFGVGDSPLYEVPAQGGKAVPVLKPAQGEKVFYNPSALPAGRGVLFLAGSATISLWKPDGTRKVILQVPGGFLRSAAFSPSGHVVFDRWDQLGGIWALPFSLEKLEATGPPFRISDVGYRPTVSGDGTLVCGIGGTAEDSFAARRMVWVSRSGKVLSTVGPALPGLAGQRVSPDGGRVIAMGGDSVDGLELWLIDLTNGQPLAITSNRDQDSLPVWWDNRTVVFGRRDKEGWHVFSKQAEALAHEEVLAPGCFWTASPENKMLIVLGGANERWNYLSMSDPKRELVALPRPLQSLSQPQFSPDGRRLAYWSREPGQSEVYVVDFPGMTRLQQVSRGGGWCPQWSSKTGELFFLSKGGGALFSAKPKAGDEQFEEPSKVFDLPESINPGYPTFPSFYAASPEGDRFLMLQNSQEEPSATHAGRGNAMVVEHWFEEFREKK